HHRRCGSWGEPVSMQVSRRVGLWMSSGQRARSVVDDVHFRNLSTALSPRSRRPPTQNLVFPTSNAHDVHIRAPKVTCPPSTPLSTVVDASGRERWPVLH